MLSQLQRFCAVVGEKMVMRHLLFAFIVILQSPFTNSRNRNCPPERCGSFDPIPFPFHLNSSCQSLNSDAFLLSCSKNLTSLFVNIASQSYQVLHFFPDATGILIDYLPTNTTSPSPSSSCRPNYMYSDLTSSSSSSIFNLHGSGKHDYYSISTDNILSLYDCNDSSLCKPQDCEKINGICTHGCCYSLSDPSNWHIGDPLSVFSQYGCRGFSSWVVFGNNVAPKRGVKLEWAIPRNLIRGACDPNARTVNVTSGMRCQCLEGFIGDGFAQGVGCLKSCLKNRREAYGRECDMKQHGRRRLVLLSGVLASAFSIASLTALFCLLKGHSMSDAFDDSDDQSANCRGPHLFTYQELEEATKGFIDSQKLADMSKGTIFAGTLVDGTHLAVQKVQCTSKNDLMSRVELLYAVSHRHMARLLGCSIDSGLVVYEYPANGTLEQHLSQSRENKIGFDWHKRLNIASETAIVLAFLQCEIIPPIFHRDIRSGCILLDEDYSVKLAGFNLSDEQDDDLDITASDVYSMGVVLLEIIAGGRFRDLPTVALHKIRSGKLEEMVDPLLYYHEQTSLRREQIEAVADLGTRCLMFGQGGKLRMNDVARELAHIRKDSSIDGGGSRSTRGPSLDETFSNSSLLQMISMSPDSIYHLP